MAARAIPNAKGIRPYSESFLSATMRRRFHSVPIPDLLTRGYIATHPVTAREQIAKRYGCVLALSGHGCGGITFLRGCIESIDSDGRLARCLMITAPHTHWDGSRVVESYDEQRNVYLNGPSAAGGNLHPFSFVFTVDGPAPYEWADETVPLRWHDWEEPYAAIDALNDLVVSRIGGELPIPLGITIDHRFKRSIFDEQVFTSAEGPHSEEAGRAVIRPVLESVVKPNPMNPSQVQIAWSAYPVAEVVDLPFAPDEAATLHQLETLLREYDPETALEIIESIETRLANDVAG
jgi:hypothetical protein